jgi:hypothetical protein
MVKSHPIGTGDVGIIRKVGVFDLQHLLDTIYFWFDNQSYEVQEKDFKHKTTPTGFENEYLFSAEKKVDQIAKFNGDVYIHLWDCKNVKAVINGREVTKQWGRILIEITGKLEIDYANSFEGSPLRRILGEFLFTKVLHKKIGGGYWDELCYRLYKLHRDLKESLEFETRTNAHEHWA